MTLPNVPGESVSSLVENSALNRLALQNVVYKGVAGSLPGTWLEIQALSVPQVYFIRVCTLLLTLAILKPCPKECLLLLLHGQSHLFLRSPNISWIHFHLLGNSSSCSQAFVLTQEPWPAHFLPAVLPLSSELLMLSQCSKGSSSRIIFQKTSLGLGG